jgi:hypothetical protein
LSCGKEKEILLEIINKKGKERTLFSTWVIEIKN